jgi:hypothetical protein
MAAAELRAKKNMKETAWMKYLRLEELRRHRWRCFHMQPSIDNVPPFIGVHQMTQRRRADIQEGPAILFLFLFLFLLLQQPPVFKLNS